MPEIENFRPRIRNWARVFREKLIRHESNLMLVIRLLKRNANHIDEDDRREDTPPPPDTDDAYFIDRCVCELLKRAPDFKRIFPVLKVEYLTRYSVEDFECVSDIRKARRARARYARVFDRDYDSILLKAESILQRYVALQEEKLSKPES